MKLELKHISPYLPYGLKLKTKHGWDTMTTLNEISVNIDFEEPYYYEEEQEFKPILRPLSDFYKKITHNSKTFIPIIELANINFPKHDWYVVDKYQYIKTKKGGYSFEWDYGYNCWLFDGSSQMDQTALHYKMLEWHFDVFGLIEKGLAININTIENQSK